MNQKIEALKQWGCDTAGALARMLDDEDFYIECLETVAADPNFALLAQTLSQGNAKEAFDCAHTLKGVLGNVGLTPMYHQVVKIVEPLRAGQCENLTGPLAELETMRAHLASILAE